MDDISNQTIAAVRRHPALDTFCRRAEDVVRARCGDREMTRRPSWAPTVVLGDDLTAFCHQLGLFASEVSAVGRLHAQFANPVRARGLVCRGFALRVGEKKSLIWQASRSARGWGIGPLWRDPEKCSPRIQERQRWWIHARELASECVARFCKDPEAHMRASGVLTKHCGCCGGAMWDPISLEWGICPECRAGIAILMNRARQVVEEEHDFVPSSIPHPRGERALAQNVRILDALGVMQVKQVFAPLLEEPAKNDR